jgi:hypothetical protein
MTVVRMPMGEYPVTSETPLWDRSTAMQGLQGLGADAAAAAAQPPSTLTTLLNAATSSITNLINPQKPAPVIKPSVAPAQKSNLPMILGLGAVGVLGLFLIMRKSGGGKSGYRSRARRNPGPRLCTICGKPIVLVPSAAERARKFGGKPSDYTNLFTTHSQCALRQREEGTLDLIRSCGAQSTRPTPSLARRNPSSEKEWKRLSSPRYAIHKSYGQGPHGSGYVVVTRPGSCPVSPVKRTRAEAQEFLRGL